MAEEETKSESEGSEGPPAIFLVSYPKIVFLYPSFLMSLIAGLIFSFSDVDLNAAAAVPAKVVAEAAPDADENAEQAGADEKAPVDEAPAAAKPASRLAVIVSTTFLFVLGINLVVLSFDFPRTTSLTLFFFIAAIGFGGVLLITNNANIVPAVHALLNKLHPLANAHFYFMFAGMLGAIFVVVAINVRFDYWEVRPNELLHHHGILSNMERFSAPHLRIHKEINDVFEFLLLRSGRLILKARGEERAIILENVFFINQKEQKLTKMLGALQVQIRSVD